MTCNALISANIAEPFDDTRLGPRVGGCLTLLLGHTHSPTPTTRRLRMLTPHTQTPVVSQPTMGADLLQTLQILTQLAVHPVGQDLSVLAVYNVALSVKEPGGNLVLSGVLNDGDDAFEFFGGDITSAVGISSVHRRKEEMTWGRLRTAC